MQIIRQYRFDSAECTLQYRTLNQSQIVDNITLLPASCLCLLTHRSHKRLTISLVQANVLSVADSVQSQAIDAVALIQSHILTNLRILLQSQSIDNIALSLSVVLNPDDLTQNQSIDGIVC